MMNRDRSNHAASPSSGTALFEAPADGGPAALSSNARFILSGLIRRQRSGRKAVA